MNNWPSDRVARGGIYQPAKVNYSPETKKFLQELMQESQMTMLQRQKVNYSLRSGDPLPALHSKSPKMRSKSEIIIRPDTSKRRQHGSIVESGAYERDKYVPQQRSIDRDFAKKHLQDFMAYGKELKDKPKPATRRDNAMPPMNRFDEIKKEIEERVEFLEDMKGLGQEAQYKDVIGQQIAARIREMEKLKCAEDIQN